MHFIHVLGRVALVLVSLAIKLFIDLPMMLLGLVVVAVALPFASNDQLPKWGWPWDNADHGIDGDDFWIVSKGAGRGWWASYQWLALRNPTFNFSKYILGLVATGEYTYTGTPLDANGESQIGDKTGPGWSWCRMGWAWEFYYIKPYSIFGTRRCVRIRAGWKIFNKDKGERCQFVFVPNPLMTYSGK